MVKLEIITKKKVETKEGEPERYEEVDRRLETCDQATSVFIDRKGNASLALYGMVMTEGMGCLGYFLRHIMAVPSIAYPDVTDKSLLIEVKSEISGPDIIKPREEKHEYLRGIMFLKKNKDKAPYAGIFNISEMEAQGAVDICYNLQLMNISMGSAMRNTMMGPSMPGRGGLMDIPRGLRP